MTNDRASVACDRLLVHVTEKDSGLLGTMQSGDVLVSHSTAVREPQLSIVPKRLPRTLQRTTSQFVAYVQRQTPWASAPG